MYQSKTIALVKDTSKNLLPNPMHLPWCVTRLLDRKALRQKLNIKGAIGASSSHELEQFLVNRAGEARDLFALRGVRTHRTTVFQLMSRSIAADLAANDNPGSIDRFEARRDEKSVAPASLLAALR